jgi:hypothetical protein
MPPVPASPHKRSIAECIEKLQKSMRSVELSRLGPLPLAHRAPYRWTEKQRTTLLVLNRWFTGTEGEIGTADHRALLCAFFKHSLISPGGDGKVSKEAIISQLADLLQQRGTYSEFLKHVYMNTDFTDPMGRFADSKLRFNHIARAHGIKIVSRKFENSLKIH